MTVNEKMISVVKKNEQLAYNTALGLKGCQQDYISGSYQETTQAVINAAWPVFDEEDKSTWPPLVEGKCYMVQFENYHEPWGVMQWTKPTKNNNWWWGILGQYVVRYAEVSDLLHVSESKP